MRLPDAGRLAGSNLPHADFLANFKLADHSSIITDRPLGGHLGLNDERPNHENPC
jgi:hypothetical protein